MNTIDDYIRENRARYTREAITAELLQSGHDQAAIDAAWERLGGSTSQPGAGYAGFLRNWALAWYLIGGLALLVLVGGFVAAATGASSALLPVLASAVVTLGLYGGIGWWVVRAFRQRANQAAGEAQSAGKWVLAGCGVLVVFALLAGGACTAAFVISLPFVSG